MTRMMMAAVAAALLTTPVLAQSTTPIDVKTIDAKELKDYLGKWVVTDVDHKKKCKFSLSTDEVIGGMAIAVDKKCAKVFPAMGNVMSWRLYEGWEIAFADAERHEVIRFYTPDNEYISYQEVDGMFTILKK